MKAKDRSPAQKAFYAAVKKGTDLRVSHPDPSVRCRTHGDRVHIDLAFKDDGSISIREIVADKPAKGHGGKTLDWLCTLADRHQVPLVVSVIPFGKKRHPLNSEFALRAWYGRRGFEGDFGFRMVRAPATHPA